MLSIHSCSGVATLKHCKSESKCPSIKTSPVVGDVDISSQIIKVMCIVKIKPAAALVVVVQVVE